jgi:hypothetical protein
VRRDLGHIDALIDGLRPGLTTHQSKPLQTARALYAQQRHMYDTNTHSVPSRIVSIPQPWVRPIVRGKTNATTESGAKVQVGTDEGLARIEHMSFEAFNGSEGLIDAVESYRMRNGHCPDRLLVDKIYRTRKNLPWCKERAIRVSGPRLGRPPKDLSLTKAQKAEEAKDAADRNVVEGVFGTAKVTYGLDPVKARLEQTTKTVIAIAILVFNLKKLLAVSLSQFPVALISLLRDMIRHLHEWQGTAPPDYQLVME